MKNKFLIFSINLFAVCFSRIHAQQIPLFSQNNQYDHILNPATAHRDNLVYNFDMDNHFSASFRTQWTGIEDGPKTGMLRYDRCMADERMIAGISLLTDQTGPTSTSGGFLRYAYLMPLGDGTLSVGLAAGFFQNRFKGDASYLRDAGDAIGLEDRSKFYVDFSLGAYYQAELTYNDIFYMGLSMPTVTDVEVSNKGNEDYHLYRMRHYHGSIGYVKFLSGLSGDADLSFLEPSLSINYAENAPAKANAALRFQLQGLLWVGGGYSMSFGKGLFNSDDLRLEAGVIVGSKGYKEQVFKIGYAANFSLTPYNVQLGSTHEVNLSYSF